MAKIHRTENGIAWLEITCAELSGYSGMDKPICDECLDSLIACENIVLIPILNEAFCPKCGKERLSNIRSYPEDYAIEQRREKFWLNYFGEKTEIHAGNG